MFVYEFKKKPASLLKAIVISGNDITFYGSKPMSPELQMIAKDLGLQHGLIADHRFHIFLHHPVIAFSAAGDNFSHQHLKFAPDVDHVSQLTTLFHGLFERQKSPLLRGKDFTRFWKLLDKARIAAGDEVLPSRFQTVLDDFDTVTPYCTEADARRCLDLFKKYTIDVHFQHIEKLRVFIEKLIDNNFEVLYTGCLFGDPSLPEDIALNNFRNELMDLRELLLTIDQLPLRIDLYQAAIISTQNILSSAHMPQSEVFFETMQYFKKHLDKKVSDANRIQQGAIASISFLTNAIFFMCWDESSSKKAMLQSLFTTFIIMVTYNYVNHPLKQCLTNVFASSEHNTSGVGYGRFFDLSSPNQQLAPQQGSANESDFRDVITISGQLGRP